MPADDLLAFGICSDFQGKARRLSLFRHNRRPTALFGPEWIRDECDNAPARPWIEDPRYYVNLNPVESRVWAQILVGLPISAIARTEGVTRQAIYARIAGNRKGQGGMIAKNFWVLLWWRLRQQSSLHQPTKINNERA